MADVTELTIDELAREAGMTVRNVRAHQSRGLLPPPEIRGRTGYYGAEHRARLELIKELQAEGFNLEAIKRIIENAPAASSVEVLNFTRALTAPFSEEQPEVVELEELQRPWGGEIDPALARKVQSLGLLRPLGDGRFEVRSPRLMELAAELADLGVPLEAAVEIVARVKRGSRSIARAYVDLFLEQVWRPLERDPSEIDWGELREALDRLRPLASQSLIAVFGMVMTDAVEETMERELERLGEGKAGRDRGRRSTRGRSRRRRSDGR